MEIIFRSFNLYETDEPKTGQTETGKRTDPVAKLEVEKDGHKVTSWATWLVFVHPNIQEQKNETGGTRMQDARAIRMRNQQSNIF